MVAVHLHREKGERNIKRYNNLRPGGETHDPTFNRVGRLGAITRRNRKARGDVKFGDGQYIKKYGRLP